MNSTVQDFDKEIDKKMKNIAANGKPCENRFGLNITVL